MKLSDLAKKIVVAIIIVSLICVLISLVYYRSAAFLPFMFGVALGAAASIAKVFLLERAIDKALKMEQKQAGLYVSAQHILRLLITGAVLLFGALVPAISLWGVVAGVFSYQIGIYGVRFSSKK